MNKALDILKQVKELSGWIKCGAGLPFDEELDEAIAELEEAMKPKSCLDCLHRSHLNEALINNVTNGFCAENGFFTKRWFYCNRYKPKDNA